MEDSPNPAGVVIDAIRCCKIARDRGLSGPVMGPSSYFMKSQPVQYTDEVARQMVEDFIVGRDGHQPIDEEAGVELVGRVDRWLMSRPLLRR